MTVKTSGLYEFIKETQNRDIILVGAALQTINNMVCIYPDLPIYNRITNIVDNDPDKALSPINILGKTITIKPTNNLPDLLTENAVLLIMANRFFCADLLTQLFAMNLDCDCYIYDIFPWFTEVKMPPEIKATMNKNAIIPKKIHYVWFGGKPLPEKYKRNIETWRKFNPDYEIICHNEDNYDFTKISYMKQAYEAGKYAFVSDVCRLDVLSNEGGIYLDTDVKVLKNFDPLLYHEAFWATSMHSFVCTGSAFGCTPGHTIVREMFDEYRNESFFYSDGSQNLKVCDLYQARVLRRYGYKGGIGFYNCGGIILYPTYYFTPKNSMFGMCLVNEDTYSIHDFSRTWMDSTDNKRYESADRLRELILGSVK